MTVRSEDGSTRQTLPVDRDISTVRTRALGFFERERDALLVGSAVALFSAGLLWLWVLRAPFVGLANNGDWYRYLCPLDLVSEPDVFFERLPGTLVSGECDSFAYDSSFQLVIRGVRAADDLVSSPSVSLRMLALAWALLTSVAWGWLGYEVARRTGRALVTAALVVTAVVVASDISFSSYFGSLYAEAMVFALVPLLAAALVRVVAADRIGWPSATALAVITVAVTTAKPQMALTGVFVVAVIAITRRGRGERRWLVAAGVGAAFACVYSLAFLAAPEYTEANTVNLVFSAVLVEADDPSSVLEDLGVPADSAAALAGFTGSGFWPIERGPASSAHYDDFERSVTRSGVLTRMVAEPGIAFALAANAVETLGEPRLDYLANHMDVEEDGFLARRPAPASASLALVSSIPWIAVVLSWAAGLLASVLVMWRSRGGTAAVAALAAVGVATAASQTLISVGDGYYELEKHLVVGQYATAVTASVAAVALLTWVAATAMSHVRGGDAGTGIARPNS